MSHQNSPAKKQEQWEKLYGSLEIDITDADTTTIKTMESGTHTTRSDGKYQEYEIQKLLDEVDRKCNKEKIEQLEELLGEADRRIEGLNDQIIELEERLRFEKGQTEQYFKALDTLELENERLRTENATLSESNEGLKKSLYIAERQIEAAKKESVTLKSRKDRREVSNNPLDRADRHRPKNGAIIRESKAEEDSEASFDASRASNTSCERTRLSFYVDDSWIKKLKFLKEKLSNERKKSKNLQFLVDAQKNFTENTNQTIQKLKADNRTLEQKLEMMGAELEDLSENKAKEKAKIDNVITFCDLINTCSFNREEIADQLFELPTAISSFLKGSSDTIVLKSKNISPTFSSQKLRAAPSEQNQGKSNFFHDQKTEEMAQELDSIRKTLNNVSHFLSKMFPNTDPSVLNNLENLSKIHLTLQEGLTDDRKGIVNARLAKNEANKSGFGNSRIFTKAIQNSNSLLWNLKLGSKSSKLGTFGEGETKTNQENIDANKKN